MIPTKETSETPVHEKLPQAAIERMLLAVEHLSSNRKHNMSATRHLLAEYGVQGAIAKMVRNGTNNPSRIKNVKALMADGLQDYCAETIVIQNPKCFEPSLQRHATAMLKYCGGKFAVD